jgi:DNA-binding SARP family transcriptional activator
MEVHLFGKPFIKCGKQHLADFPSRRAGELFYYLMLFGNHPIARETLAGTFWAQSTIERSKRNLRQALWELTAFLNTECNGLGNTLLLAHKQWIGLGETSDLWVDVAAFEQAYSTIHSLAGEWQNSEMVRILNNAVSLYAGELLEGCYDEWCLSDRLRLHNMHLSMLEQLMEYAVERQDPALAIEYGSRILRVDIAHEQAHRGLMRALYLLGDRTTALRQYEHCTSALQAQLGVEPSKETQALYQQICADELHSPGRIHVLSNSQSISEEGNLSLVLPKGQFR